MKKILLTTISSSLIFGLNSMALAATDPIGTLNPSGSTGIITKASDLGGFLSTVIRLIVALAGIWSLFQFLIGGFTYITGAGDPKKTQEATQKILHAIIGLVIIAVSFLLAGVIGLIFFGRADFILNPSIETN